MENTWQSTNYNVNKRFTFNYTLTLVAERGLLDLLQPPVKTVIEKIQNIYVGGIFFLFSEININI